MANEVEVALLLQQVARTRRVAAQYLGPDEDEDIAELQGGALEELQREFRCGGVKCVRCQVCQVSGLRSQCGCFHITLYSSVKYVATMVTKYTLNVKPFNSSLTLST